MGANDQHIIRFSRGTGTNFGKARNIASSLSKFIKLFDKPTRTAERFKTYLSLSVDEQQHLKSIDGWVYRTQIEGKKRNRSSGRPSDIFSLDLDYATPEFMDMLEMGLVLPGFEFFAHSTRRHTDEKPRLRIYGVFSRPVVNEEYGPLSRIIATMFDPEMKMVDKVSFRPAQMMFLPTASIDGDFFFTRSQGQLFDPDAIFEKFTEEVGDWKIVTNWPRVEGEEVRQHADKAEDPTTKRGPVGDFCRAYDVIEAIDTFLPDKYVRADDNSEKPRYTFLGGTTTSGAVVEDGGLFLYSHHGSDPCCDMLVNAFDLVRIHKFGDTDEDDSKDAPMNQRPSWKAMIDFIAEDPGYRRSQAESRYDQAAMFDDVMDEYFTEDEPEAEETADEDEEDLVGTPGSSAQDDIDDLVGTVKRKPDSGAASAASAPKPKRRKPPEGWFPDELELDKQGNIVQNLPNAQVIIHNDPRLFDAIAYDDFMKRVVLRRDILSKMPTVPPAHCRDKARGDIWQDYHDITVRAILAAPNGKGKKGYGIDKLAERDLAAAIYLTAMRNKFHPIKDYLESVAWDGVGRIDTLFVDYLGVEDTIYAREAARCVMVASVCRVFEPGHKFDYAPVIQGPQGIRKSTFIEVLYGAEYFGELTCNLRDTQKIAETIGGTWGMEFPELAAFYKSDHNDAKQFLSAKEDRVRMAYDRRVSIFPRQATFWGTTNDKKYLKDPTGNRRWWPIIATIESIDTNALADCRDQLWAEAMAVYRDMRAGQAHGTLPLYLRDTDSQAEAKRLQEDARTHLLFEAWAGQVQDWLDDPITLQQFWSEYQMDERLPDPDRDLDPEKVMVVRTVFRVSDAAVRALGIDGTIKNDQMTQNLDRAISHITGWLKEGVYRGRTENAVVRRLNTRGRWWVKDDATESELADGYRIVISDTDDLV